MWRLFDFDKGWTQFYTAWSTNEVQNILHQSLLAHYSHTEKHELCASWTKNSPLWDFTMSNFWLYNARQQAKRYIDKNKVVKTFHKQMQRAMGERSLRNYATVCKVFDSVVYPEVEKMFLPQPQTLESILIFDKPQVMSDALYHTVLKLYPNENICRVQFIDNTIILLLDSKVVVDVHAFYCATRHPKLGISAESIVTRIASCLGTN